MNQEPKNRSIREALGMYEALRRLGFLADDVYLIISQNAEKKLRLFCSLHTQDKESNYDAGPIKVTMEAELQAAVAWWNDTTQDRLAKVRLYRKSDALKKDAQLLLLLLRKGFVLPCATSEFPSGTSEDLPC